MNWSTFTDRSRDSVRGDAASVADRGESDLAGEGRVPHGRGEGGHHWRQNLPRRRPEWKAPPDSHAAPQRGLGRQF